jgi:hypothetical protein
MNTWARRIYQWGLGLYPARFRDRYCAELLATFDDLWSEAQAGQGHLLCLYAFLLWDLLLNCTAEHLRGGKMMLRRWFDITLSLSGLFLGLSVFPLVAVLIKLDSPGPVFYTTTRLGKDGQPFTLYKLRTMVPTENNGRRITAFGGILRRSRFDEWPQFYNILIGDMTFVGPRPQNQDQPNTEKLTVKPGFLPGVRV